MAGQSGPVDEMDEIVAEFLVESHENLDELDQQLVALESSPGSRELLAGIFRTIHTIKGTSGFLAFGELERVTHVGETLLARLRDGRATATPQTITVLLSMVDAVRQLLALVETQGTDTGHDTADVLAAIKALLSDESPQATPDVAEPLVVPGLASAPPAPPRPPAPALPVAPPLADETPAAAAATGLPVSPPAPVPAPRAAPAAAAPAPVAPAPTPAAPTAPAPTAPAPAAPAPGAPAAAAPGAASARPVSEASVRVDVDLLEQLMTLVGELVLTRNQVLARAVASGDAEMLRVSHRLDLVASELQEGVMKTRMQPIDHLWSKLPRVVRDLGVQLGRSVRLAMEGAETELDRTLLEAVKDPLTHLVRNAVDHGLEPEHVRRAAGKDPVGTITLRATHEGGQVLVEVSDDGAGMDPGVIGARALERGLVTQEQLARMTAADVLQFVFTPGFSTASAVTNVSGRGVGMDVVKTNIERIGGTIDLESAVGTGSTARLRIPLTLAIVPALTVACSGERFAIPQSSLRELVGLDAERRRGGVEHVGGAEVHRLRGQLLPLVRLHEVLGLPAPAEDSPAVIAVLDTGGRPFGLVVDTVLETQEIVVKPLGPLLSGISAFSGATVLGDGGLALILDVPALSRAGRDAELGEHPVVGDPDTEDAGAGSRQLLLVGVGARRVAIPLELVTRLEEVAVSSVEHVGRRAAVQYRGEILPVVDLAEHLGVPSVRQGETAPMVVYASGGRSVAIVVDEILDVVQTAGAHVSHLDDAGLLGSAVIRDRITELLDVRQAVLAADPRFYLDDAGSSSASPAPSALQEVSS